MVRSGVAALALGAFALVLAACGGGSGGGSPTAFTNQQGGVTGPLPTAQVKPVNIVLAGIDYFPGENNFVFGITDKNDEPVAGATAKATFYDLRDPRSPKPLFTVQAVQSAPGVGATVQHIHQGGAVHEHGGQDDNRVAYYVDARFDWPGDWGVAVEATLKDGTTGSSNILFKVRQPSLMPAPGEMAPRSDNLTRRDVADVKEIDSGSPANDMHDVKIREAIAAGRPLVVVFATPAYCTSRFCGPVTEEVELLHDKYKDKVDFVHIEIWRNFGAKLLNPTAAEWLQQPNGDLTEPIVYVVDKNGVIFDRWEGPAAGNIMEPSVKAVAEGAVFK